MWIESVKDGNDIAVMQGMWVRQDCQGLGVERLQVGARPCAYHRHMLGTVLGETFLIATMQQN